jgi:hypothetical protein
MSRYPEIDIRKVKTVSIRTRKSKIRMEEAAGRVKPGSSFAEFWESLPAILAGKDLKDLAAGIAGAVKRGKPVLLLAGAHVIKVGLSPVVIQLMEAGVLKGIALNGAGAIHDVELAYFGHTSENVGEAIRNGRFGMARETADILNHTVAEARRERLGFGESLGRRILGDGPPNAHLSILAQAYRLNIPVTVHAALGTDIVHQHPSADGAAIGEASLRDFRIFTSLVSGLHDGGVVLLFGSAVILPEVFLKALTVARNVRKRVSRFTTANFDMIRQYRPGANVVERPTRDGGVGYHFTGHHEIMLPLLATAVLEAVGGWKPPRSPSGSRRGTSRNETNG